MIDYDAELQLHNERLRAAYDIEATDRVLDIGRGTGQTTREAARLASNGEALGIDIEEVAIARARELADLEGLPNARFEASDVQVHPFQPSAFDVAISRFGTMFFADPHAAFRNIARAIRADGRLVMMVWQTHDQNEWSASIDHALGERLGSSGADDEADPHRTAPAGGSGAPRAAASKPTEAWWTRPPAARCATCRGAGGLDSPHGGQRRARRRRIAAVGSPGGRAG